MPWRVELQWRAVNKADCFIEDTFLGKQGQSMDGKQAHRPHAAGLRRTSAQHTPHQRSPGN